MSSCSGVGVARVVLPLVGYWEFVSNFPLSTWAAAKDVHFIMAFCAALTPYRMTRPINMLDIIVRESG